MRTLIEFVREAGGMSDLPIAVGSFVEQKRFIERNAGFLREYPKVNEVAQRIFLRKLTHPNEADVARLLELAPDDPAVTAFEDKQTAERIVFYLGRMAVDDFGEILTLAGNGRGFGAYKIVRGMYERVVTAFYLAKNPSEARAFAESSAIAKLNYLKRTFEVIPESRNRFDDGFMRTIEEDAAKVQAKRKTSICSKCHQPITQEAWTRVALDVMAKSVEPALAVFYPQFYLEGTAQSHATMFGMERRLVRKDGGISYKETSEEEARFAVHLAHHLMLRLLIMQNDYFSLGLTDQIRERADAFAAIWAGQPPGAPPES